MAVDIKTLLTLLVLICILQDVCVPINHNVRKSRIKKSAVLSNKNDSAVLLRVKKEVKVGTCALGKEQFQRKCRTQQETQQILDNEYEEMVTETPTYEVVPLRKKRPKAKKNNVSTTKMDTNDYEETVTETPTYEVVPLRKKRPKAKKNNVSTTEMDTNDYEEIVTETPTYEVVPLRKPGLKAKMNNVSTTEMDTNYYYEEIVTETPTYDIVPLRKKRPKAKMNNDSTTEMDTNDYEEIVTETPTYDIVPLRKNRPKAKMDNVSTTEMDTNDYEDIVTETPTYDIVPLRKQRPKAEKHDVTTTEIDTTTRVFTLPDVPDLTDLDSTKNTSDTNDLKVHAVSPTQIFKDDKTVDSRKLNNVIYIVLVVCGCAIVLTWLFKLLYDCYLRRDDDTALVSCSTDDMLASTSSRTRLCSNYKSNVLK